VAAWGLQLLLLLLLGFTPGAAQALTPVPKVTVAASIVPLGDFCRQLGGSRVDVQVVIPPGASPHVFEPQPSVVAKAMAARVFVYVGAGLDPWAERLLHSGGLKAQRPAVVAATAGVPLLRDVHGHKEAAGHDHEPRQTDIATTKHSAHAGGNPHIWLDPVLAQDICRRIAQALIQADPAHRSYYEANLGRFLGELEALHREIEAKTAAFRLKAFVSFHPSFTYFARRYGLQETGVIEMAPGREPTPRHIQRLVAAIRRHQVQVVFGEPQLSSRVAQIIAKEAGVKVLVLDPLGGNPPYGEDYLKMMRHNLNVMEQAMR
jgi:zinc transport system substrate-binding protein